MCYAIPGKVKQINNNVVVVDYFGEQRKAINELAELKPGDYIYAQGGYVIEKIPSSQAESILSVWKETFFELQEVDLRLSQLDLGKKDVDKRFLRLLDKCLENTSLSQDELLYLLNVDDYEAVKLLYKSANFLRQKYFKNSCCIHGIIEISNYCKEPCCYCGISSHNKHLKRYRMTAGEVIDTAVEAVRKFGFRALVLQSGQDPGFTVDELAYIIRSIKQKAAVFICISFGEIGIAGLKKLYDAGARAMLMRFETSNAQLYSEIHPGARLDMRLEHIKQAYAMGYLIMTGALIGIPGQTSVDIINDIMLAKKLHAEMFSFGPFLPHHATPFAKHNPPKESLVLKVLSLARLADPLKAKILITTAFETLSAEASRKGLLAGANSLMLNITPADKRRYYEIYPNRKYSQTDIATQIDTTLSLLHSLGRAPSDLGLS